MAVSYKKLWHILLDRDMKKKDLAEIADLTPYLIKKLSRDEPVTTETVGKICTALNCKADDIMEFYPDRTLSASEKAERPTLQTTQGEKPC